MSAAILKSYNGITCHMHAHTVKDINGQEYTVKQRQQDGPQCPKICKRSSVVV